MQILNSYEILTLVHPDHSEQINEIIEKHKSTILQHNGKIDRLEDWGRRNLAYSINNVKKAHYLLFNVTCPFEAIDDLEKGFYQHNESVLRHLVLKLQKPVTEKSFMMKQIEAEANDTRLPKVTAFKSKDSVDYKSKKILKNYLMETGRIVPSRLTNTPMLIQRKISKAIKLARFAALLPYCDRHD